MMKHLYLLSFILILSSSIQAQNKDWEKLQGANYSLKYPSDWDLDESGMMNTKFILFSEQTSATDAFKENVNLLIQDLSGMNITMDQYVELTTQQIKNLIQNSKLITSDRVKDGENDYHKFHYNGDQGPYKLTFIQRIWIIDEKAYVLTFTAEQDQFSNFKILGEEIFDSFKIK